MIKANRYICYGFFILILVPQFLFSSEQKKLDELLSMSLQELIDLQIVTATKTPQKIEEVPAIVRIITSEEIKLNHYLTLDEALADLPGMQFRNIQGLNSYVFMRGIPSQNNLILVLIDGIQINELNSGGFYGGGQYNLSNVERIEVVYGPASALYGTNAISGIVNIITKNPENNQGLDLYALYGTFNTANTGFNYGYWNENQKWGIRFSGMYKTSEKADLKEDAGDNNWSHHLDNFEDDYAMDLKCLWNQFTFGLNYQNKQTSTATSNKSVGTIYRDTGTLWNIHFINSYLKHRMNVRKNLGIRSQIYYRNATVLDNSVYIVTDTAQVGYYRPNKLLGLECILDYTSTQRFNWIGGIVFESEELAQGFSNTYSNRYDIRPPTPEKPKMNHNTLFSFYGQLKYMFTQSLEFYTGARFDNSSVYDQVFTPRLGLVYNRKRLTAKLLYAEAFRAPKPWDYTDGNGNPNLMPEEMVSLELNTTYYFPRNFRFEISIFSNKMEQLFIKEQITENTWRWINHGQLNTLGLETGVVYESRTIQSYFNYSLNQSRDENELSVPEISKHQLNCGMSVIVSKRMQLKVRANYYSKRKNLKSISSTGSQYVDPALIFHSNIIYSLNEVLDIQFSVKNLLNAEYYHTSNFPPERYRQPQRTLLVQANYRLK